MKTIIAISIDTEVALKLKELGISPTPICNEALWRAVGDPALLIRKESRITEQLSELQRIKNDFGKEAIKIQDAKTKKLRDFLNLPDNVLDNPIAMDYWSKELSRSVEELASLKRVRP